MLNGRRLDAMETQVRSELERLKDCLAKIRQPSGFTILTKGSLAKGLVVFAGTISKHCPVEPHSIMI